MKNRRMTRGFPVALAELVGLSDTYGEWDRWVPTLRNIWRWAQLVLAEERIEAAAKERARIRRELEALPKLWKQLSETEDGALHYTALAEELEAAINRICKED